jgi:hypothetical protein
MPAGLTVDGKTVRYQKLSAEFSKGNVDARAKELEIQLRLRVCLLACTPMAPGRSPVAMGAPVDRPYKGHWQATSAPFSTTARLLAYPKRFASG